MNYDWQEDIGQAPVTSSSRPQPNYVPAAPVRHDPPSTLWQPAPSGITDVWRPTPAVIEQSTPVERAQALVIRQLLLWVVWMVLAVAAGFTAYKLTTIGGGYAALFGLIVFGGCAAASFIVFDRAERNDSATGLEKHRINQAAELERLRLQQDFELKRQALEAYLDAMGGQP